MPAIVDSSAIVLVTGANGFLGTWIVQQLLEKGYCVRAAVRNTAKGTYLQARFKSYKQRLEIVIVEDMTKVRLLGGLTQQVLGIYKRCQFSQMHLHTLSGASMASSIPHHLLLLLPILQKVWLPLLTL
jgi:GDP-D-mannose dehydratase